MLTNAEKAELVALTACVFYGMSRRPGAGLRDQVKYGLGFREQIELFVLEALGPDAVEVEPKPQLQGATVTTIVADDPDLLASVREFLGIGAKRQVTIEDGLGLSAGALDGLLVEGNGFSVNAQGWVRVMEPAGVE